MTETAKTGRSHGPRVLVSGSAVMDFVFHLDAMPDRPEKYRSRDAAICGGGNAANAAVALARLGGEALIASRLGDDAVADLIVEGLEAEGVNTTLVRRYAGHRSPFSSVFIDVRGERQIVGYRDMGIETRAGWLQAALPVRFDAALADTRWPEGALALMLAARAAGVPGVIDAEAPVRDAEAAVAQASHVAFSAQGLRDWDGTSEGNADADLGPALERADRALPGTVLVTDGEHGTWWREGGETHHRAARPIVPVDTLAAGDVWHGAFALHLARAGGGRKEHDLAAAVEYANAAATFKCTRGGGRLGAPSAEELARWIEDDA